MLTLSSALTDMNDSLKRWRLWHYLALSDIRLRYRRSVLGPWWITITMLIFSLAMGVVYGKLFKQDPSSYMPFVLAGFLIWNFIALCVNDATEVFRLSSGFIRQINLPFCVYIYRNILRNIFILAHNFVVYLLMIAYFKINPGWNVLWVLPGFMLLLLNLNWLFLFLGIFATRFRDVPLIVTNLLQVLFFVSPITWMPKLVGTDSLVLKLNPVVYCLDLLRAPLLGQAPEMTSWIYMSLFALVGNAFAFVLFAKYRHRIPFWVN